MQRFYLLWHGSWHTRGTHVAHTWHTVEYGHMRIQVSKGQILKSRLVPHTSIMTCFYSVPRVCHVCATSVPRVCHECAVKDGVYLIILMMLIVKVGIFFEESRYNTTVANLSWFIRFISVFSSRDTSSKRTVKVTPFPSKNSRVPRDPTRLFLHVWPWQTSYLCVSYEHTLATPSFVITSTACTLGLLLRV